MTHFGKREMTRVKMCNITDETDLATIDTVGTDVVSAIYDVPVDTSRETPCERIRGPLVTTPPFLTTTLMMIPDSADHTRDLAREVGPDVLQLHGDFAAGDLDSLHVTGAGAVPAVDAAGLARAHDLTPVASVILVNTPSGSGVDDTGETHDRNASCDFVAMIDAPVILADDLTPDNVIEAVRTVEPYDVDVVSGIKASNGVEDHDAVYALIAAAEAACRAVGDHERVVT